MALRLNAMCRPEIRPRRELKLRSTMIPEGSSQGRHRMARVGKNKHRLDTGHSIRESTDSGLDYRTRPTSASNHDGEPKSAQHLRGTQPVLNESWPLSDKADGESPGEASGPPTRRAGVD